MLSVKIQCPAKINLTLKVLGKRPDGFHNIESIMQTISLYDYLTINVEPSEKLQIELSGNCAEIPYNEKNSIVGTDYIIYDDGSVSTFDGKLLNDSKSNKYFVQRIFTFIRGKI